MNPFQPLVDLANRDLQPFRREVWVGLGFKPPKRCAIAIDPARLPADAECWAVAGLDINVLCHGHHIRYSALRGLCGALFQAKPRRLQVFDLDFDRRAILILATV